MKVYYECDNCGLIESSEDMLVRDGNAYCQNCSELGICEVCGTEHLLIEMIEGDNGDWYCSKQCYEASVDHCTYCGAEDTVEIEYCDSGEHCSKCCSNFPWCEDQEDQNG